MISVSDETKEAFLNGATIHLYVTYSGSDGSFSIPEERLVADSMILKEAVEPSGQATFGGGISNEFQVSFYSYYSPASSGGIVEDSSDDEIIIEDDDSKIDSRVPKCGDTLVAKIQAGDTDIIPLFKGYVSEMKKDDSSGTFTLIGHDVFYYWSTYNTTDISDYLAIIWKEADRSAEKDTKAFMEMFFETMYKQNPMFTYEVTSWTKLWSKYELLTGITYLVENPGFVSYYFDKSKWTESITANDVIKCFADLSCLFAKINRDGGLVFLTMDDMYEVIQLTEGGAYTIKARNVQKVPYSKSFKKDDEFIKDENYNHYTIGYVQLINSDGDILKTEYEDIGSSTAEYRIENNFFLNQRIIFNDNEKRAEFNASVYLLNYDYELTTMGLPWVEVGDSVVEAPLYVYDSNRKMVAQNFAVPIYCRELKGIQNLTDTFSRNVTFSKKGQNQTTLQNRVANLENSRAISKVVTEVPETFNDNTIYYVVTE